MLTREQAVEAIREAAADWRAEADREGVSESLAKAYIEDAIDLRLGADLFEAGADEAAWRHITGLDTMVRECLAMDVWDFLEDMIGWDDDVSDE